MFALFKDKKFIGYSPDFPQTNGMGIDVKDVPDEYSNVLEYTWVGDSETGKFTDVNTAVKLKKQIEIDNLIQEKFPIQQQLINIINQLYILSQKNNIFDIEFKEMTNEIKKICNN